MKIGSEVQVNNEIGIIISMDGRYAKVDVNGEIKTLLSAYMKAPKAPKIKSYMKEEIIQDGWSNTTSVKNQIVGNASMRGSNFDFTGEWTKLMKISDEQNHFTGSIIMTAIDGGNVSEKQAWAVAFFAKSVGLAK